MTVLVGANVVTADGVLDQGWVQIRGTRIVAAGGGTPPEGPAVDLSGAWLLPGFIDVHVHGGGGHDFSRSATDLAGAAAYHLGHGTTRTVVSLVTAPVEQLCVALALVADAVEAGPAPWGQVVGAHLEGPFLSPARCGAQHPDHLLAPDWDVARRLLSAGRGFVRSMTVAPELPGALTLIERLVDAGVVVSVGHTDATYAQTMAAFNRGATVLTHTYNAMRPVHNREPGPVAAALDAGAYLEVINDGVHVHPAAVRMLDHGCLVLVTDSIAASGCGDGTFRLGGQEVMVVHGQARLARTGVLAGSTLTMADALRGAVHHVGMSMLAACAAASSRPAALLGIGDRCGAIAPGLDADLVALDDDFRVIRVMAQGRWTRPRMG